MRVPEKQSESWSVPEPSTPKAEGLQSNRKYDGWHLKASRMRLWKAVLCKALFRGVLG